MVNKLILTNRQTRAALTSQQSQPCTVLAYEDMSAETMNAPAFRNYDLVLIDDADQFFNLMTGGLISHLKDSAEVRFDKNCTIS